MSELQYDLFPALGMPDPFPDVMFGTPPYGRLSSATTGVQSHPPTPPPPPNVGASEMRFPLKVVVVTKPAFRTIRVYRKSANYLRMLAAKLDCTISQAVEIVLANDAMKPDAGP
jgi:hypothetical protein